jgi:hypothetical protein
LAAAYETTEVVTGVPGAGGCFLEAEDGLVFGCRDSFEVGQHLVAELRALDLGAEPCQLVPTTAPTRREILARHA